MSLPKGVWFEETRQRYRVRIVRNKMKIHLSYHKTKDEAVNTYEVICSTLDPKVDRIDRLINQTKLFYKQRRR
jgi:hypothetical protein